jgi:RNA polymerase sigma factor (sigma-70 family)
MFSNQEKEQSMTPSPLSVHSQSICGAASDAWHCDDTRLIESTQAGDVDAFNMLVERYQNRIYGVCLRMLGTPEDAADVTQESLLAAYRSLRRFQGGSFVAWLLRIAINRCYDHLRARRRRPQVSLDMGEDESDEAPRQYADISETPEEYSLRQELAHRIERHLDALPVDQRVAVIMSDIHGYRYEEIAAATGWPIGSVKSRLHRGRAQLRLALHAERALMAAT